MKQTLFGYIFAYSKRQQIILIVLTFAAFPFIYFQAELPKRIVNGAIQGRPADFPKEFYGYEFEHLPYLFVLCGLFLLLVLINGGFKYVLNVMKGRLGERMLRRLRYILYERILRFPLPHFRRVSQGELIPMVTQEVEPLGGFFGDALALPLYQGGILVTLLVFILMQDPWLGLAAVALFPIQGVLVPRLQKKVNQLAKQRVQNIRILSDQLGESISGISEIHTNDSSQYQLSRFSHRLGIIYEIRYEIFRRKFFIKFFNNFLAQFTPFLFYSLGGYLAITGNLSVGALIAVISAHKDMNAPWKELLAYYQQLADARIKYDTVIQQFDPPGMMEPDLHATDDIPPSPFPGEAQIALRHVGLADDDGTVYLHNVNLAFGLDQRVAFVGPSGGGKEEIAPLLVRLIAPTSGRIQYGDDDLGTIPEARLGRRIGYVSAQPYLFSASIRENLLLALRTHPPAEVDESRRAWIAEAETAGNSIFNLSGDWIHYEGAGLDGSADDLQRRLRQSVKDALLADDIYEFGLRGRIDGDAHPHLVESLLEVRAAFRERVAASGAGALIEPFDPERYNRNATFAENLLFGTPVGTTFDLENLGEHPYVRETLDRVGLTDDVVRIGRKVAETMVELFADIEPGHELMEQFSFIAAEDLPEFQALLGRIDRGGRGLAGLGEEDRSRLMSLPFRLIPARHRLDLLDDSLEERLLEARHSFAEHLPEDLKGAVAFFDPERYNSAASIQDNILFGKVAYGQPQGAAKVRALVGEVLNESGLHDSILDVGLEYHVGVAGGRLSAVQRQKLAFARALAKQPDLLVVNQALSVFDESMRGKVFASILEAQAPRGVVAVLDQPDQAQAMQRIFTIEGGRVEAESAGAAPITKAAE
ncbi:MAG: ABC transporter ATP-binding protein [Alphaproteobacteria bacterium]|nr:ABC transporter ATP-binding protein [Alphaproteobacteria bacterium]MCB9930148.1 ABC transporter ATP-binding protein [Alphaproteobacteria bacterium]